MDQSQKKILAHLKSIESDNSIIIKCFKWFGSYLIWIMDDNNTAAVPFVSHLRGRTHNPKLAKDYIDGRSNNNSDNNSDDNNDSDSNNGDSNSILV